MKMHSIGRLSPSGVLDLGRKCPHSCVFCFYSYYEGENDQFGYLRRASYVPQPTLRKILDQFKAWGLTHFDYTGGEPSLHPEVVEITDYAHHELGLKGRMITLAQFLMKKLRGSEQTLLEQLLGAGLTDFLFSFHTVDSHLFKSLTGGKLELMQAAMDTLDEKGFSYCTNTVVNHYTCASLPATARCLVDHRVRIANFIMMRMDWGLRNAPDKAIERKGQYSEQVKYLREAIDILDAHRIAVNVRYVPYCMLKGYERHIVGYKGLQFDPYEWRNGTLAASQGVPYLKAATEEEYVEKVVPRYENDPVYNQIFSDRCASCALRSICDGADATYIADYGWDEFEPYSGERVTDLVHFRRDYPGPFQLKEDQYE
jgi:pyrroloquinoline quinone biosynthesis protein E